MISRFHVQNFRSILDLEVDLSYAEGKAPNGWADGEVLPFVAPTKRAEDRMVPVLAFYGANASGKTNVIRALHTLQKIVRYGIEGRYNPNRLNPKFAATRFEIEFRTEGDRFDYCVTYEEQSIRNERLRVFQEEDWRVVFEVGGETFDVAALATEAYSVERLRDFYRVECARADGSQTHTWFDCIGRKYEALSSVVQTAYDACLNGFSVYLSNEIDFVQSLERLSGEGLVDAKARVARFLKKFDLSIESIAVESREISRDELVRLVGEHVRVRGEVNRRDGKYFLETIDFGHKDVNAGIVPIAYASEESEGTRLLAGVLATCLHALDCGTTVCFDELDRSLHPLILIELVKLFKLKKYNRKGAQLIFTAHDPTLMEDSLMRLGEIGIVNNGLHSGTTLKRLTDLKKEGMDIRNVHNFRKMYMDGFFAGIPYPTM